MVDENTILKKKINLLIDKVMEHENTISELKSINNSLLEEKKTLEKKIQNCVPNQEKENEKFYVNSTENEVYLFIQEFNKIIKKAVQDNAFIPYSYDTKNSHYFYKIEKDVFDQYVQELSVLGEQNFMNYCIGFLFIKSERNGRCTYNNNKIRVYFLNKKLIDVIAPELPAQEEQK
ncbi:hypothetical protein [Anaeromicropila populeti]|uniref:Uncharacterized protein n=1 Tax=Anaeromicropila populeti TaxID=37658 RepID=A0A1I6LWX9_9FIRM|nr:hypothetical protein [Anaeromicropila populeti]SFS07971.1 hypothetical protein SAMN05661086_03634 [Anaeromicropila populeti]